MFPRLSIVTSTVVTSSPLARVMGVALKGTFLRRQQEGDSSWQGVTRHPHINRWLRSSVVKCISASEELGYRQMVLIYGHRSFGEKVSSEAN